MTGSLKSWFAHRRASPKINANLLALKIVMEVADSRTEPDPRSFAEKVAAVRGILEKSGEFV